MPTNIKKDIRALESGELDWAHASLILIRIRDNELWRPEASSFSDFLKQLSIKTHRKINTYWRTIGSGEYYLRAQKKRPFLKLPALATIGKSVSPENLELIEKIARVAPDAMIDEFLLGLVDGKIGRTRLKNTWDIFRNAVEKTENIYIRRKDFKQPQKAKKSFIVDALLVSELLKLGSKWCCQVTPEVYKFFSYVRVSAKALGVHYLLFIDAVAVVQEQSGGEVEIHGVFAASMNEEEGMGWNLRENELTAYRQFLDRSWIAVLGPVEEEIVATIPAHAGVIEITHLDGTQKFAKIIRRPSPTRADGVKSGILAKYLLLTPGA
jgi:hypothetical protein